MDPEEIRVLSAMTRSGIDPQMRALLDTQFAVDEARGTVYSADFLNGVLSGLMMVQYGMSEDEVGGRMGIYCSQIFAIVAEHYLKAYDEENTAD